MLRLKGTATPRYAQTRRIRRLFRPGANDFEMAADIRAASSLIGSRLHGIHPLFGDHSTGYFPNGHSSDTARRSLYHFFHRALPPSHRFDYCRLLSSGVPRPSDEEYNIGTRPAIDDEITALSRESHERRVAEAQARIVARRKKEYEAKNLIEEKSERKQRATRRHFIVNIVRSWLAKDPTFYEATMKVLNIFPEIEMNHNDEKVKRLDQAGSARRGSRRENSGDAYLSGQLRGTYIDSVQSFRNMLEQEPPPRLQCTLQQLDDVGFGDPSWHEKYKLATRYEFLKDHHARVIKESRVKLNREQDEIELLEFELVKEEQLAQELVKEERLAQKPAQPPPPPSQTPPLTAGCQTVEKKEAIPAYPTFMSQAWDIVSSFIPNTSGSESGESISIDTSTNATTDTSDARLEEEDKIIEQDKQASRGQRQKAKKNRKGVKNRKDDNRNRSASSEESIREKKNARLRYRKQRVENLQYKIRRNEKKISTLLKEFDGAFPDGYRKARNIFESARDMICQELGYHIKARHRQVLEQYQVLDGIAGESDGAKFF